jgi:hypothetical protein
MTFPDNSLNNLYEETSKAVWNQRTGKKLWNYFSGTIFCREAPYDNGEQFIFNTKARKLMLMNLHSTSVRIHFIKSKAK